MRIKVATVSTQLVEKIPVIDADTHLVEPPDLWTSRMSSKWGDLVPHVVWDEQTATRPGSSATRRVTSVGGSAMAGWSEYPPDHPRRWSDTDPATWEASARLRKMDEYGIHAQVLYPNVALFNVVPPRRRRRGPDARVPAGVQRLPDRFEQRGARPAAADDRRCRSGTSTRRWPRSSAVPPWATAASCSRRTPARSACRR